MSSLAARAPSRRLHPSRRARLALVASVVVTVALYALPHGIVLAYPLMLLSTLAHELGHGVTALLVGGSFHRFEIWPDGSGVAQWSGRVSRLDLAAVAAGGLVGPAVVAAMALAAGRRERGARTALYMAAGLLCLAQILVVRNVFGFVFVGLVILLCWLTARYASGEIAQLVLVFLAVQLALSVFSRGDYLFTATADTAAGPMPSDTGQMAAALLLPFWFWGVVCGAISLAVVGWGLRTYWR